MSVQRVGPKHPTIQHLRRLSGRRSARAASGTLLVEGGRAVADAVADGVGIEVVVTTEAALGSIPEGLGAPVLVVADHVLGQLATTVTPQPVLAEVRWAPLDALPEDVDGIVLVLAGLSDPGNAGAVLRVAEAAGCALVVFADDSVDPCHPKVVRAAAGSLFRVLIAAVGSSAEAVQALSVHGYRCVGLDGSGSVAYDTLAPGRVAVVIGSEAHGLPLATREALAGVVSIPMAGRVESLNAAVAAALVLYHLKP